MFDDVKDGLKRRHVATLYLSRLKQTRRFKTRERLVHFIQRPLELRQQLCARDHFARLKFQLPLATIRRAADAAHNPLPRVARQMTQQIADAVRLFARAPPSLLVSQTLQTAFDLRQVVSQKQRARLVYKSLSGFNHDSQLDGFATDTLRHRCASNGANASFNRTADRK